MARALNKKYFGNRNIGSISTTTDNGIGGKSIASFALGTAGSHYSLGLTATVNSPEIVEGVNATVSVGVNSSTGAITGYTIIEQGSGYINLPTITLVKPTAVPTVTSATYTATIASTSTITIGTTNVSTILNSSGGIIGLTIGSNKIYVGMLVSATGGTGSIGANSYISSITGPVASSYTITLSTTTSTIGTPTSFGFSDNGSSGVAGTASFVVSNSIPGTLGSEEPAIYCTAKLPTASTSRSYCDIIKQVSGRRYKVQNTDGVGICQLVSSGSLSAGQMTIGATDSAGNTYFVTKLTNHMVTVQQNSGSGFQFTNGQSVRWSLSSAVANSIIKIDNA